MGNGIEKKRGWFGHTKTRTRILGNETEVGGFGNNLSVKDAQGNPLITSRRHIFGGQETRIDGNRIWGSIESILNTPAPNMMTPTAPTAPLAPSP